MTKPWQRIALAIAILTAGLTLRLIRWPVPLAVTHVAGGLLWAMLVYVLVSLCLPPERYPRASLTVALLFALAVELSRLIPGEAAAAVRATLAGQMILGRIFSPWNLATYAAGILIARRLLVPEPRLQEL